MNNQCTSLLYDNIIILVIVKFIIFKRGASYRVPISIFSELILYHTGRTQVYPIVETLEIRVWRVADVGYTTPNVADPVPDVGYTQRYSTPGYSVWSEVTIFKRNAFSTMFAYILYNHSTRMAQLLYSPDTQCSQKQWMHETGIGNEEIYLANCTLTLSVHDVFFYLLIKSTRVRRILLPPILLKYLK